MRYTLLPIFCLAFSASLQAQTMVTAPITMVRTGWNDESFAVVLSGPIANPANCGTKDGYITNGSLPGYKTYYAAVLTAYATQQPVMVVVHNTECFGGRPKLIGVNLPR